MVMIEDNEEHVQDQPENAIVVPPFTGDPNDMVLLQLIPLLKGERHARCVLSVL